MGGWVGGWGVGGAWLRALGTVVTNEATSSSLKFKSYFLLKRRAAQTRACAHGASFPALPEIHHSGPETRGADILAYTDIEEIGTARNGRVPEKTLARKAARIHTHKNGRRQESAHKLLRPGFLFRTKTRGEQGDSTFF